MSASLLFLGDIGGSEMILIVVVILIFFGANKIPELARGLGKGIREFKDASSEIRNEFERAGQPGPPPTAYQQPDPYQQPPYNPASQPYHPYQPHPEGYQAPPVAPTDYEAAPPVADYHIPYTPPTEYSAPGTVVLPPAAPVPHHHDTPIPPASGVNGTPGTRPRLDQTPTDV
jgi:sec-independent protein translocase protein TatA